MRCVGRVSGFVVAVVVTMVLMTFLLCMNTMVLLLCFGFIVVVNIAVAAGVVWCSWLPWCGCRWYVLCGCGVGVTVGDDVGVTVT